MVINTSNQLTADVLVGTVGAVLLAVTEQSSLDAVTIATGQRTLGAQRLLGVELRLYLALLVLELAVVYRVLPVAGLLVDVEVQTGGTTNRLETGTRALYDIPTVVTVPGDEPEPLSGILVLADLVLEAVVLVLLVVLTLHSARSWSRKENEIGGT